VTSPLGRPFRIECSGELHQVHVVPAGERIVFDAHPDIYVEVKRKLAWNALVTRDTPVESLCPCEQIAGFVLSRGWSVGPRGTVSPYDDSRRLLAVIRGIWTGRRFRKREARA